MAIRHYLATAKDGRTLELPEEAQALGIQCGEVVSVGVERVEADVIPNEKALAALREIARLQEGMRYTSGDDTLRMIREGRGGAIYGNESSE